MVPIFLFAGYAIEAKLKGYPGGLSASKAFTSLSLMSLIVRPAQELLGTMIRLGAAAGSISRIQAFLTAESHDGRNAAYKDDASEEPLIPNLGDESIVSVSNVVMQYFSKDDVTDPISFSVSPGSVVVILGPVGSGKTTMLRTLLGECVPKQGKVSVKAPTIGYCSQNAWIQRGSVRKNIIGPLAFNEAWYHTIVEICDLNRDFEDMKDSDSFEVGPSGTMLSGKGFD
jgi:ATP-binding cassette, subfamily C (CFTR/MRP), member 1